MAVSGGGIAAVCPDDISVRCCIDRLGIGVGIEAGGHDHTVDTAVITPGGDPVAPVGLAHDEQLAVVKGKDAVDPVALAGAVILGPLDMAVDVIFHQHAVLRAVVAEIVAFRHQLVRLHDAGLRAREDKAPVRGRRDAGVLAADVVRRAVADGPQAMRAEHLAVSAVMHPEGVVGTVDPPGLLTRRIVVRLAGYHDGPVGQHGNAIVLCLDLLELSGRNLCHLVVVAPRGAVPDKGSVRAVQFRNERVLNVLRHVVVAHDVDVPIRIHCHIRQALAGGRDVIGALHDAVVVQGCKYRLAAAVELHYDCVGAAPRYAVGDPVIRAVLRFPELDRVPVINLVFRRGEETGLAGAPSRQHKAPVRRRSDTVTLVSRSTADAVIHIVVRIIRVDEEQIPGDSLDILVRALEGCPPEGRDASIGENVHAVEDLHSFSAVCLRPLKLVVLVKFEQDRVVVGSFSAVRPLRILAFAHGIAHGHKAPVQCLCRAQQRIRLYSAEIFPGLEHRGLPPRAV